MKINLIEDINIIRESALLVFEGMNYNYEKIELLEDRSYLDKLDEDEIKYLNKYTSNLEKMFEEANIKLKDYKHLNKFVSLGSEVMKKGYLANNIIMATADNLEELNIVKFKIASLLNLVIYDDDFFEEIKKEKEIEKNIDELISLDNIYPIIENIDLSLEEKFLFLDYFKNIDSIYKEYVEMLKIAEEIYRKYSTEFAPYFKKSIDKYKLKEDTNMKFEDLYISDKINIKELEVNLEEIQYYISIILYNQISFFISAENRFKAQILEGALFFDLLEIRNENEEMSKDLEKKIIAIGDRTRIRIINMLNKKEYYAKEISEILKISPSTVSHHIDILLNNDIIKMRLVGRRAYYSLDKDSMNLLSEEFKKFGGD